jgi:hypothetical protein
MDLVVQLWLFLFELADEHVDELVSFIGLNADILW